MRRSSRAGATALLLFLAAVAAAGAYAGVLVASDLTEQGTTLLAIEDPTLAEGTPASAHRSAGGFSGFGDPPALPGAVFRSGTVSGSEDGRLTVAGPGSETIVSILTPTRLYRIRQAAEPLAIGDLVLVRVVGDEVVGVLRLELRDAGAEQQRSP